MFRKYGGYIQHIKKNDITCTCKFGSLYPNNYQLGEQVCKHIKQVIKELWKDTQNAQSG